MLKMYRGADEFLARPRRKQASACVRMAWISFGPLPCRKKKNLIPACASILLKSRASLTSFQACFLPGRAKDLSAPGMFAVLFDVAKWPHTAARHVRYAYSELHLYRSSRNILLRFKTSSFQTFLYLKLWLLTDSAELEIRAYGKWSRFFFFWYLEM